MDLAHQATAGRGHAGDPGRATSAWTRRATARSATSWWGGTWRSTGAHGAGRPGLALRRAGAHPQAPEPEPGRAAADRLQRQRGTDRLRRGARAEGLGGGDHRRGADHLELPGTIPAAPLVLSGQSRWTCATPKTRPPRYVKRIERPATYRETVVRLQIVAGRGAGAAAGRPGHQAGAQGRVRRGADPARRAAAGARPAGRGVGGVADAAADAGPLPRHPQRGRGAQEACCCSRPKT